MNKPLAIYIHWPFCLSKCPYCDFNSHVRESVEQERWKSALLTELETMAGRAGPREVHSIFFGGGTPSLMPPATVAALIERIHALFPVSDQLEITLEANPTSVEADNFRALREAGVGRVSLGVQSLRQEELTFLGRGHNVAEAIRAIHLARDIFPRYSFDLIYARPRQTLSGWEAELGEALALTGGHLSLYQLTIEENTAFHHAYAKGKFAMPDEDTAEAMYRLTEEMTGAQGLMAYEVSNYATPGQESRHNMAYWLGNDYLGIGPGAHGRITQQGMRHASQTLKSPERWLENVEKSGHALEVWQPSDHELEAQERLMMGLRLKDGIHYDQWAVRTGLNLREYLDWDEVKRYQRAGLLVPGDERLQTTLSGRLVLNRLTAELLK